jgi:transposase InsO family protein
VWGHRRRQCRPLLSARRHLAQVVLQGGNVASTSTDKPPWAIAPGHPEQNGRHERLHLALKQGATRRAAANVFPQQARFDAFVEEYTRRRPHQALGMQPPAAVYRSARVYRGIETWSIRFMTGVRATRSWYDLSAATA